MLMVSRFLILGFSEIPWGFVLLLKNVYRRRALKSRSDLSETPLVHRNLMPSSSAFSKFGSSTLKFFKHAQFFMYTQNHFGILKS